MTIPNIQETGEEKRQRVRENLRRLKEAGRPQAEVDDYLASERETPHIERDANDLIGGAAQTAVDAATFGLEGLVEDAITSHFNPERFRETRDLRAENKRAVAEVPSMPVVLPGGSMVPVDIATAARVGGTLLNPVGRFIKPVKAGAGIIKTALNMGAEGGLQAGAQAAGENIGTSEDPTGLRHAAPAAATGFGTGTVIGGMQGALPYARSIRDIARGKNLGERAVSIDEAISRLDKQNYGKASAEAQVTPPVTDVLEHDQMVAPLAKQIREEAAYQGRPMNDAEAVMAAYRRLSSNQRRAQSAIDRSADYRPELSEGTVENIKAAKQHILDAVEDKGPYADEEAAIPNLRHAIQSKAKSEGARSAFEEGSDMAKTIALGRDVKGSKLLQQSPAAWTRRIQEDYSPQEARRALQGVQGRVKEIPEFSSNPLTTFNIVPSVVRTGLAVKRLQPIMALLEEKAGRSAATRSALLDYLNQTTGRVVGGETP